eukprot:scaffold5080_cov130-Cylindrotheca_fusiformis.AAC.1
MPAVYVPSSPYNIVPPQLLIKHLKEQGCGADSQLNNELFQLRFSSPSNWRGERDLLRDSDATDCVMSVPLDRRNLFTMWTNPGYQSFFSQASQFNPEYAYFAGASHVIPPDETSTTTTDIPTTEQPREPSDQPREPTSSAPTPIPFEDSDFDSAPSAAVPIDFELPTGSINTPEDPNIVIVQRKQHRLAVLHEKYGHLSFSVLQKMAKAGYIPSELANVDPPKCPGCAYGKAHRIPWRRKGAAKKNRKTPKVATSPGQVVSVDQLVSPTAGFVPTHRGRPSLTRYLGATVFVDHFSDFTYVHLMTEMDAAATVEAKLAFERLLKSHGVYVQHYHADNGLFDTKLFKTAVQKGGQSLTFCGVNAHHQNGKAENRIKLVTEGARTALLHAAHRWPKAVNASLWPAALKNHVNLRNSLPTEYVPERRFGRKIIPAQFHSSPLSKLSGTEVQPNLDHFHPFGSPVYVLENSLQSQNSHNKWSDRSRVGIYLSHSPSHASSVPLVLNTQTGLVSPQFHCIYDDGFDTCRRDASFESLWQSKAQLRSHSDLLQRTHKSVSATDPDTTLPLPAVPPPVPQPRFVVAWDSAADAEDEDSATIVSHQQGSSDIGTLPTLSESTASSEPSTELNVPVPLPNRPQATPPTVTTRSGRQVTPNRFYFNESHANTAYLDTFSPECNDTSTDRSILQPDCERASEPHPAALMANHIFSFVSSASDPDTMTFDEAMRAPDRAEFIKAMHKELSDHIGRGHWKIVPISTVKYPKRPIPMVWAMKRKRNPVGEIIKWKARLCAGGHKSIENVDYWSTYSPVVSWSTVRLMIVFALLNDWHM